MNSKIAQKLSPKQFKRRFGVDRATFKQLVKALKPAWRQIPRPGVKPKLKLEQRVLICLEYWREYRTYFHIGSSWGVSESTVCRIVRWVEENLMRCGQFRLPGKKQLVRGFGQPQVVVMDVMETPIERPCRRQRCFYSGKKRRHTFKCQIVIDSGSGRIICTFFGKGRQHDFLAHSSFGSPVCPQDSKLAATLGIRVSKSYMPTAIYLTRSLEAGNSHRRKKQTIES